MKYVTSENATKSDDWKCLHDQSFNAGEDSHRVYVSEKCSEQVLMDGKDVAWHLAFLWGNDMTRLKGESYNAYRYRVCRRNK